MMATFDKNQDGRLNYQELYKMGSEIIEGDVPDFKIGKKVKKLEESGWVTENI